MDEWIIMKLLCIKVVLAFTFDLQYELHRHLLKRLHKPCFLTGPRSCALNHDDGYPFLIPTSQVWNFRGGDLLSVPFSGKNEKSRVFNCFECLTLLLKFNLLVTGREKQNKSVCTCYRAIVKVFLIVSWFVL